MEPIRLGDVAIAAKHFEFFTEFGIQITTRNQALQTFLIQPSGLRTYVPTERTVHEGSSAIAESNVVGPEGGQMLAERTVKLINTLWPEP